MCTRPSHARQGRAIYTTQAEFESDLPNISAVCAGNPRHLCVAHAIGFGVPLAFVMAVQRFGLHRYLPRCDTSACTATREQTQRPHTILWKQSANKAPDSCGLMTKACLPHRVCGLANDTRQGTVERLARASMVMSQAKPPGSEPSSSGRRPCSNDSSSGPWGLARNRRRSRYLAPNSPKRRCMAKASLWVSEFAWGGEALKPCRKKAETPPVRPASSRRCPSSLA